MNCGGATSSAASTSAANLDSTIHPAKQSVPDIAHTEEEEESSSSSEDEQPPAHRPGKRTVHDSSDEPPDSFNEPPDSSDEEEPGDGPAEDSSDEDATGPVKYGTSR